jgi:hypothetical protein
MSEPRRHPGWMALCVVAGLLAVGVVVNAVRAVFAGSLLAVLPIGLVFLFCYWISVGAYRRAIRRPD